LNDNAGGNDNENANVAMNENENVPSNDNVPSNENGNGNDNDNENLPALGVEIAIPNEGNDHVPTNTQVSYDANPPASGPHWSEALGVAPVNPGFFELTVEEEQWIHNLEHGYVVILYDCDPCAASLLEDLQDFFDDAPPSPNFGNVKMVITPYDGLPYSITAVAWDIQLHLDAFDEEVLTGFYLDHVDDGPEDLP